MASIMEGPLSKWTNVMKGWQYRWFVLDYNAGLLSYYTSKDKMMRGSRRGCVRLRGAVIGIDDEDDSTFTITVDQKTFHFQARDADEREKWIHALEETILRHTLQLQPVEKKDMISIRIWLRGIVRTGRNLTRNAIESVKWYVEVAKYLGLLQQRKIPLRNVANIVAVTEDRGISGF